jgi:hypothetical protein
MVDPRENQAVFLTSSNLPTFGSVNTVAPRYLCPDLLTIHQIGAADNLRGRVVRAFFRVMEWIPW